MRMENLIGGAVVVFRKESDDTPLFGVFNCKVDDLDAKKVELFVREGCWSPRPTRFGGMPWYSKDVFTEYTTRKETDNERRYEGDKRVHCREGGRTKRHHRGRHPVDV